MDDQVLLLMDTNRRTLAESAYSRLLKFAILRKKTLKDLKSSMPWLRWLSLPFNPEHSMLTINVGKAMAYILAGLLWQRTVPPAN